MLSPEVTLMVKASEGPCTAVPGTWHLASHHKPVPAPPTFLGWVLHLVPTRLQYLPWPLVGGVGSRCQLSVQPDLIWGKEFEATDLERWRETGSFPFWSLLALSVSDTRKRPRIGGVGSQEVETPEIPRLGLQESSPSARIPELAAQRAFPLSHSGTCLKV